MKTEVEKGQIGIDILARVPSGFENKVNDIINRIRLNSKMDASLQKTVLKELQLMLKAGNKNDYADRTLRLKEIMDQSGISSEDLSELYASIGVSIIEQGRLKSLEEKNKVLEMLLMDIVNIHSKQHVSKAEYVAANKANLKILRNVIGVSIAFVQTTMQIISLLNNFKSILGQTTAIASATEEMTRSVETISQSAVKASEKAETAKSSADLGLKATGEVLENMNSIAGAVTDTVQETGKLSETSEKIGEILGDIERIAKQTNLLALNATIEAARAGAYGKGFAVVAGEVKSLAGETSRSAEDVKKRVGLLAEVVGHIEGSVQNAGNVVEAGRKTILSTGERMDDISKNVSVVSDEIDEITKTMRDQLTASQEISQGASLVAASIKASEEQVAKIVMLMGEAEAGIVETTEALSGTKTPPLVCELTKLDHIMFKKRILDTLSKTKNVRSDQLATHHSCRLGKWYDAIENEKIKSSPHYVRLLEPHKKVHECGKRALELFEVSAPEEKISAEIDKMDAASEEVLTTLTELANELVES